MTQNHSLLKLKLQLKREITIREPRNLSEHDRLSRRAHFLAHLAQIVEAARVKCAHKKACSGRQTAGRDLWSAEILTDVELHKIAEYDIFDTGVDEPIISGDRPFINITQ